MTQAAVTTCTFTLQAKTDQRFPYCEVRGQEYQDWNACGYRIVHRYSRWDSIWAGEPQWGHHSPTYYEGFVQMNQLETIYELDINGTVSFQNTRCKVPFYVMKGNDGSPLSYKTARAPGTVDVVQHVSLFFDTLCSTNCSYTSTKFTVQPVAQHPRRILFHVRSTESCSRIATLGEEGNYWACWRSNALGNTACHNSESVLIWGWQIKQSRERETPDAHSWRPNLHSQWCYSVF